MDFEQQYYEAESFWSGDALADPANMRRFEEVCDLIPDGVGSLLDLGCGNGRFGSFVRESRPDIAVMGVDRSAAALKHVAFESLRSEIDAVPLEDRSHDCVTCLAVIEHLPVPVFQPALDSIKRLARSYAIISVPYDEAIEKNVTQCPSCLTILNVDLHLHRFSEARMQTLLGEDFVALQTIYPASKRRRVGLDTALARYQRWRAGDLGFLSPIFPVCGYSEGDRTHLSLAPTPTGRSVPSGGGWKQKLLNLWPTYRDKGYQIATLYKRRSN